MGERSAELVRHFPRSAGINPWPIWGLENEDEWGEVAPGPLWMELIEVTHPDDGTLWVTCMTRRLVMLRKDVLDLSTVDEHAWGFKHEPKAWNSLGESPCAVPTRASFLPEVVAPLLPLGVKVLPLTDDDQVKPMAHAIMRSEDLIGYVMSCRSDRGQPLPGALQVPDRSRSASPGSATP